MSKGSTGKGTKKPHRIGDRVKKLLSGYDNQTTDSNNKRPMARAGRARSMRKSREMLDK